MSVLLCVQINMRVIALDHEHVHVWKGYLFVESTQTEQTKKFVSIGVKPAEIHPTVPRTLSAVSWYESKQTNSIHVCSVNQKP